MLQALQLLGAAAKHSTVLPVIANRTDPATRAALPCITAGQPVVGVEVFGEAEVRYLQQNLKPEPVDPALAAVYPNLAAYFGGGVGGYGYGRKRGGGRGGRGGRGRHQMRI